MSENKNQKIDTVMETVVCAVDEYNRRYRETHVVDIDRDVGHSGQVIVPVSGVFGIFTGEFIRRMIKAADAGGFSFYFDDRGMVFYP